MWRSRQWRKLLNLIDHLPSNTHFYEAMSKDEEYARMVVEAEAKSGGSAGGAPPMSQWSMEASLTATLIDKVEKLISTVIATQSTTAAPKVVPYPRPKTALDKVRAQRRNEKHERLVAALLPNRTEG